MQRIRFAGNPCAVVKISLTLPFCKRNGAALVPAQRLPLLSSAEDGNRLSRKSFQRRKAIAGDRLSPPSSEPPRGCLGGPGTPALDYCWAAPPRCCIALRALQELVKTVLRRDHRLPSRSSKSQYTVFCERPFAVTVGLDRSLPYAAKPAARAHPHRAVAARRQTQNRIVRQAVFGCVSFSTPAV